MTENFGARLRRQREEKQLALADIAAATKINIALFRGLERDDVSRWPSGIFRRSFIRAYAEAIGLDPDAVCHEFLERYPDAEGMGPTRATGPAAVTAGSGAHAAVAPEVPGRQASTVRLRLMLADARAPFSGGRLLRTLGARWRAAIWDAGTLVAVGLLCFVALDEFWMPFGVTALCYYLGSILALGNTPGVCLFAPRPRDEGQPGGGHPAADLDEYGEPFHQMEDARPSLSISSEAGA